MPILNWIDVGKVAAERDENLKHYFYDAGVSRSLIENQNIFLMLGRKGAGKTAVFLHLSSKPELFKKNDVVLSLSLANYSWNAHSLLRRKEKTETFSFRDSWKFVILIESIKGLVEYYTTEKIKIPEPLEKTKKLLEKIFAKPIPSWVDLVGEKLFKLSKIKLPSASLGDSLEDISIDVGEVSFEDVDKNDNLRNQLTNNIEYLTNWLESQLEKSLDSIRLFILFDRLDEAWDKKSYEICKDILTGLIIASDYITIKFRGRLRPILFLREDIFETLSFNDKNKLKEDCGALLKWDKESLEKMILVRINYFAKNNGVPEVKEVNNLFDRKELRSRATPFNYILRNTFMRPRDLICFMKNIVDMMKEEKMNLEMEDPDSDEYRKVCSAELLISDMVYNAESKYSEWLKKELIDEWETQKPEITTYLDLITNIGKASINRTELETKILESQEGLDKAKVKSIMSFLFDISVIGFKVGNSTLWRFKCNYPSQGFTIADIYRIHFGLIKALNLTENYSQD